MPEIGQIKISPRIAIHREFENTRQQVHQLIDSLDEFELQLPSSNPAWTNMEVINHMILGLGLISLEAKLIQKGIWIPKPNSILIHRVNPFVARLSSINKNRASLHRSYDRMHRIAIQVLRSLSETSWRKSFSYPSLGPPSLDGYPSIENLFRYHAIHVAEHTSEIQQGLINLAEAQAKHEPSAAEPFTQMTVGIMEYPGRGWRKTFFKAPILIWRLGLGRLAGNLFALLTQTGRISGLPRRTVVEYYSFQGIKYVPCAFGLRSDWYQNILANPEVTLQTASGSEHLKASRVTDDRELLAVYTMFKRRDPALMKWYLRSLDVSFDPLDLIIKKDRIYWIRFDPTKTPTPPPQPADLVWVWLFALVGGLITWQLTKKRNTFK
jgi:deazaflavin-dependent oxidoreductase (nitroreductase family)